MGQKVNPVGLRVGINRTWDSRWFSAKDYAKKLVEDLKLRAYVTDKLKAAGISKVIIERAAKNTRLTRGLLVTGRGIPRSHCEVKDADGNVIGEVTSGTFSPTLKQGIALALCDRSVSLGDEVVIDVRGRAIPATVTKPPFVEVGVRAN